jgi:hypothetical protein
MNKVDANLALVFGNAFEMVISLGFFAIFFFFVISQVGGWRDLFGRIRKVFRRDFQGGPYDMMVGLMCLGLATAIRSETSWEWRMFDTPFRSWQLLFAIAFKTTAMLCIIRISAPSEHFNKIWVSILLFGLAFATLSCVVG